MDFKFREGTSKDLNQLKAIAILSYAQFENVLDKENWNKLNEKLQSEQSYIDILKIAKCFVCEIDQQIIGVAYIVSSGNPTDIFQENWSYIRMVGVNPKYRGHGISKLLTQKCIENASNNGEKIIALHTSEFMNAARHIYESLGFNQIKELQPIFGKRYWLYLMNLKVSGINENQKY